VTIGAGETAEIGALSDADTRDEEGHRLRRLLSGRRLCRDRKQGSEKDR
jgi:hypothetical protein